MEFSRECWCGSSVALAVKLKPEKCDARCPGDENSKCGGYLSLSVYQTGFGGKYTCIKECGIEMW